LIEELESHGFYCSCLSFDSIYLKEDKIFKFTNPQNILKVKETSFPPWAKKYQKIELEFIKSTANIISYLLNSLILLLEVNPQMDLTN